MGELAVVGFGELGASLAEGLSRSGRHVLRVYTRGGSYPNKAASRRLAAAGLKPSASVAEAISGADAVLSVVPVGSAGDVAREAAATIKRGALYVDLSSSAPEAKRQAGDALSEAGAAFVDAAVLGTVAVSGFEVPILASGPGAREFEQLAAAEGLQVRVIDGPVGKAALVKLLRGIYLKGRDALIVEMLLAARRNDLQEVVIASIESPGERVEFSALADRVLQGVAIHAARRADELAAASEAVRAAGLDPALTKAGEQTLRRIAALGLRERFGTERPDDAEAVLAAIDELDRALNQLPAR